MYIYIYIYIAINTHIHTCGRNALRMRACARAPAGLP